MKEASNSASRQSPRRPEAYPYVVAESEIRAYVESQGIFDLSTVAARFQIVADLTSNAFEESKDRLTVSELGLIKRIADEDDSKSYRRLMRAIVESIGQGRHGINAAHLTAIAAVGMAFRWSREYHFALDAYTAKLRQQSHTLFGRASAGKSNRAVLRVASHR